jgi:hypothetical protein
MGSSSLFATREHALQAHDVLTEVQVEAAPLDEILGDSRVDILKIDAEGAEPSIFAGAEKVLSRNGDIKIFMEFASTTIAEIAPRDFLAQLRARGFRIQRVAHDDTVEQVTDEEVIGTPHNDLLLDRTA